MTETRLDKFVDYQHFAPAIDPITYVAFAKDYGLDKDACVMLAWYHSLTYCEITAAYLFMHYDEVFYDPQSFWDANKPKLIFGSARRYVKNMGWFVPLMWTFRTDVGLDSPYKWLEAMAGKGSPRQKFKSIEKYLGNWKYMGRFSIDLFLEAIVSMYDAGLLDIKLEPAGYDWKKSSNLTSGLMNIFNLDREANMFDKTGVIAVRVSELDDMLDVVIEAVETKYPEQQGNLMSSVNKICSFRNLFKGARYGGYHHDRQLGNLLHYQKAYPEEKELWDYFFRFRKQTFPAHMLGELKDWTGIRPARKKLWKEKGLTGVERE